MSSAQGATTALNTRYLETVTIHNREFQKHSVDHNIYLVPVDEPEIERLEDQHHLLDFIFDEKLVLPPNFTLPRRGNVLDCGFGGGSWAVEVAENYPQCEVIGVDISPHMTPDDYPENFVPQIDDINEPFTFKSNTFDLVQSRLVAGGVNKGRWQSYIRDIKRVLKPGGWVQMIEYYHMCQSDNGAITDSNAIRQWSRKYMQSLESIKDPRAGLRLQNLLGEAGFEMVELEMIRVPLCAWSADPPKQARVGDMVQKHVKETMRSLAILPLTKMLSMTITEVDDLIERATTDALNASLKPYFSLYLCIGRKPEH